MPSTYKRATKNLRKGASTKAGKCHGRSMRSYPLPSPPNRPVSILASWP